MILHGRGMDSFKRWGCCAQAGTTLAVQLALRCQAHYVEARLDARFRNARSWDSLVTTAHASWKGHAIEAGSADAIVIDS